jgi:ubiquinone biosynthesis protein UbiJ
MRPIAATINHLLAQDAKARAQLMAHQGKVVCIDSGAFQLKLQANAAGYVDAVSADAVANVTIKVAMSDVPLIMANRERAVSYVKIEGDADFANTISQLSQQLRWDAEDDLSRVVGDIAATKIVRGAQSTLAFAKENAQKLAENTAEYLLEEKQVLIKPSMVTDFASHVAKTRDDVERLIKRIEKLERQ